MQLEYDDRIVEQYFSQFTDNCSESDKTVGLVLVQITLNLFMSHVTTPFKIFLWFIRSVAVDSSRFFVDRTVINYLRPFSLPYVKKESTDLYSGNMQNFRLSWNTLISTSLSGNISEHFSPPDFPHTRLGCYWLSISIHYPTPDHNAETIPLLTFQLMSIYLYSITLIR